MDGEQHYTTQSCRAKGLNIFQSSVINTNNSTQQGWYPSIWIAFNCFFFLTSLITEMVCYGPAARMAAKILVFLTVWTRMPIKFPQHWFVPKNYKNLFLVPLFLPHIAAKWRSWRPLLKYFKCLNKLSSASFKEWAFKLLKTATKKGFKKLRHKFQWQEDSLLNRNI